MFSSLVSIYFCIIGVSGMISSVYLSIMVCASKSAARILQLTGIFPVRPLFEIMSSTISRVLYLTIIYLDLLLPTGSSNLPGTRRAAVSSLFGLASDGVYICHFCYQKCGELLPRRFTLTYKGGYFLLHLPGSHLHRTLSGILPYEARTFLTCGLSALAAAIVCATHSEHILARSS